MPAFLEAIINFFGTLATLIFNLISGITQMVQMIPSALSFLFIAISSLPPVVVTFAVAFVTVSVVYLVIGR